MPSLAAKDIFRVDLSKLIRFWVRLRPDPTRNPQWVELGHFFAGLDFKLTRVREVDDHARENAVGYLASGTFQLAQNAIADYRNYELYLKGPCAVAMLFGHSWEPTHGKLLVLDWLANGDGTYTDNRIAIVADPAYNTQLNAGGTFSGFVSNFEMYLIKDLTTANGKLSFTTQDALHQPPGISSLIPSNPS